MPPVGAAIVAVGGSIGLTAAASMSIAVQLTVSTALSVASRMMKKKTPAMDSGMRTSRKLTGGINSRTLMLGRYATSGSDICPPMSHTRSGFQTPNAFMTQVIALSDLPVAGIRRLSINGEYVPVDWNDMGDFGYGYVIGGKYYGRAWIKFYDGTQTAADPMLLEYYGSYPDRPWTADMVGHGMAYAIITYQFDTEVWTGEPKAMFELDGVRLYDPRKDSSVGGSGAHRRGNPATWEASNNPIVMVYNIILGIPMRDGFTYGGLADFEDLPLTNWVAAMNRCDETVGGQPRFRAGYEIMVADDDPADAIDTLLMTCLGEVAEIGGYWKVRVGGPGLPVAFFTEKDFLNTQPKEFDPFPPIDSAHNMVSAVFPHPEEQWGPHDAPIYAPADLAAEYGDTERPLELNFKAAPFPGQVQRLMRALLKDDQRHRVHTATIGPYGMHLEPLDTFEFTSQRNGYQDKLFDIKQTTENLRNLCTGLGFREVDPNDYDYDPTEDLPDPVGAGGWSLPDPQQVPGFRVDPYVDLDQDGTARLPGFRASWDADGAVDANSLVIRWRVAGQTQVKTKTVGNPSIIDEVIVTEGIRALVDYEVSARYVVPGRRTNWTGWWPITAPDVALITDKDTTPEFVTVIEGIAADAGVKSGTSLPTSGNPNQLFLLMPEARLYRWDPTLNNGAGGWTTQLYAGIEPGSVDETALANSIAPPKIVTSLPTTKVAEVVLYAGELYTWDGTKYVTGTFTLEDGAVQARHISEGALTIGKFAASLRPVEIMSSLPTTGNTAGRTVMLTTDGKQYRYYNGAWTAAVASADIAGQIAAAQIAALEASKITGTLTNSQIASLAAAKLTGQITSTQITDNAVTTAKVNADAITAAKIAALAVTADAIAANAITAAKIAAGTITANELAANSVTAGKIASLAITTDKLAANAITSEKIDANAVTTAKLAAGAVTADQIAANAIVASKLAITDFTNVVPDSEMMDATAWTMPVGWSRINNGAGSTFTTPGALTYDASSSSTGYSGAAISMRFPVDATKEYYFKYQTFSASPVTNGVWGRVHWFDAAGAELTPYTTIGAETQGTGGRTFETATTPPALAKYAEVRFYVNRARTNGVVQISGLVSRMKASGELIVDGAITTIKLAADAVTAEKIKAGAVTADAILANSITAGKIAAGAVGADQIAARAISASKLVVADFTNLVPDSDVSDPLSWVYTGWTRSPAGANFRGAFWFYRDATPGTNSPSVFSDKFVVEVSKEYFLACQVRGWNASDDLRANLRVHWYDLQDNEITSEYIQSGIRHTSTIITELSGSITVPSGAVYARLSFFIGGGSVGGRTILGGFMARRRNDGSLIVDGAITANKLEAGSVTADAIAAGAIVASKIAAGTIGANHIVANAVTAEKMSVSTLSSISANLGVITAGTIRSGTSGERFVLTQTGLSVYDNAGNLRVRVGQL